MKIETEHGDGERLDGAEDGDMDRPNGNGVGNGDGCKLYGIGSWGHI